MFRVNGNVRAVETLKLRLESGGDEVELLSESDLCTVSSLLKRYLRDLPDGLVGSTVQQKLIQHYQGKTLTPTPTFILSAQGDPASRSRWSFRILQPVFADFLHFAEV